MLTFADFCRFSQIRLYITGKSEQQCDVVRLRNTPWRHWSAALGLKVVVVFGGFFKHVYLETGHYDHKYVDILDIYQNIRYRLHTIIYTEDIHV